MVIDTNSYGHMDTTNANGTATFQEPSGGSPVWAIDNLKEVWTVTACSANTTCTADADGANYAVTLNIAKGSRFAEFANPGPEDSADGITSTCPAANSGGPRTGGGAVDGTIEYDVNSSAGPDLSSVPATQAPNTSLSTVLSQIFDNNTNDTSVTPLVAGGGHYTFNYDKVCGSVYTQSAADQKGRGPKNPAPH